VAFDRTLEAYRALETLLADGKVGAIGVSNFMVEHLTTLLDQAAVVPAVNQIELHPYFAQREVQDFGAEHGILTQAWSPIGGITFYRDTGHGSTLDDPVIGEIATAHGKTAAQVMLRWGLQHRRSVIPKSTKPSRLIAVDLPGFGLSDPHDYGGRSLREHAVAQLSSLLEALALERAAVVGTSLGGMWALCLAVDAPDRVTAVFSLGVPAVALPGMHGDSFFTAMSTPGVRHVVARIRSPNIAVTRASLARGAIGPRAASRAPDGFFAVVHEGMRQPGYRTAMLSHLWLAMRRGHPLTQNFLAEAELRCIAAPVLMIWGDADPYGPPDIGQRAAALIPNAQLEVIPARHPPFLDDPRRCAAAINDLLRTAGSPSGSSSAEP
jgi:pimeloyl-ACP methyl ester carboxylesterase